MDNISGQLARLNSLLAEAEAIGRVGAWLFDLSTGEQLWSDETFRIIERGNSVDILLAKALDYEKVTQFMLTVRVKNAEQAAAETVLVVNVASKCGYTPQYEGLEKLYRQMKDKGVTLLGFPSNDFGGQEPGTNKEIADFCQANYGVSFPMFTKTRVSGKSAHPFYQQLAKASGSRPSWNFHKYLISRDGKQVMSFASGVSPDSETFTQAVDKLLAQPK